MGKEIELKLHIDSAEQLEAVRSLPELTALAVGEELQYRMETTYFDTPDGALSKRKWTFRQRRENDICVTCLKTPAVREIGAAKTRGEWETTEPDLKAAIGILIENGAPTDLSILTENGVIPTCGASFLRRAQLLRLPDGSMCELACDAGELIGGAHCEPFFEIELELKSGAPEQMLVLGKLLQKVCGLSVEPLSKFARARLLSGI